MAQMEEDHGDAKSQKRKRHPASVYDAVAGRVAYESFITERYTNDKYKDTASNSLKALPPEEVLFRRVGAPTRFEEDDVYFQDRHLASSNHLPNSDLLKAVHAYASDFYSQATNDGGKRDWKSLDETALLAMGILLEEAAKEALGKTGDLALVEADENDHGAAVKRSMAHDPYRSHRGFIDRVPTVQNRSHLRKARRSRSKAKRVKASSDALEQEKGATLD